MDILKEAWTGRENIRSQDVIIGLQDLQENLQELWEAAADNMQQAQ